MLEIRNVEVYDIKQSIIACRNAFRTEMAEYTDEEFNKSLPRAIQLANTPNCSGHQNFLKGIRVSFDITYPNYISPELQRYNWMDIVTSSSKMHKLLSMDLDLSCNKYVPEEEVMLVQSLIEAYKQTEKIEWKDGFTMKFMLRHEEVIATTKQDALYIAFMRVVSACPQGIELFMRCSTNYLQLKNIYNQRKHHKLIEDWQIGFCQDFIEKLPYFKEFIKGDYII